MFGTVLAMLNTSACSPTPRAAASRMPRTKPLSRETTVPAAITALEDSSEREAPAGGPLGSRGGRGRALGAGVARLTRPRLTRQRCSADAQHDAAHDHHGEQDAAGDDDVPDQPAHLAGAQAEGERGAELLALRWSPGKMRHVVHARAPLVTSSRRVVRWPGCMLTGVGASRPCTSGLSVRARRPDGDRLLEAVDDGHGQRARAAREGDEVGAGDLHPVHLRRGRSRRGRAPGRRRARASGGRCTTRPAARRR